jgi:hypothetical protein
MTRMQRIAWFGWMVLIPCSFLQAQQAIEVPLFITDGVDSMTIRFGILPGGHFCLVPSDTLNGHVEFTIPVLPPTGTFDVRFVWPRPGSNASCFDQGGWYDYRPRTGLFERDTFKLFLMMGTLGTGMRCYWPGGLAQHFTSLTFTFFDLIRVENVSVDMLAETMVDLSGAGDIFVARIFSGSVPLSVSPPQRGMAVACELHQNYPNPFNPSTTISYEIGSATRVVLKVFDVLGREVATLIDGDEAPGQKSVRWDAGDLAGGVYFCRLQAGGNVVTMRMILLR